MLLNLNAKIRYSDFRTQIMSVEEILSYCIKKGFNRNNSLYRNISVKQKSRVIETIFLNMPQMPVFIDDSDDSWTIIEGAEKVDALFSFCCANMRLSSLYFLTNKYEGKSFKNFSMFEKAKLLSTRITVFAINPGLSGQERFGVYMSLKKRTDSATVNWCRSRIFGKQYNEIKHLAQSISEKNRYKKTETLETRICNMLVGIYYEEFGEIQEKHHIDIAANSILEQKNINDFIIKNQDRMETAIRLTDMANINRKYHSVYDSIFYHFAVTPENDVFRKRIDNAIDLYKITPTEYAEDFCKNLKMIINYIKYDNSVDA
jgi:hypothetical protein